MANLPLHGGKAPRWLFGRMVKLAEGIIGIVVYEYGREEFLKRISDPFWFQALSCVLGFDWHSSGTTTVTCGALKEAFKPLNLGIAVAGGKGRTSRKAPLEIERIGDIFDFSESKVDELVHSSKLSAKVDNSAVQDLHQLYHHTFFLTEDGSWAVVQQGMNPDLGTARRYHWYQKHIKSFVDEPHDSILGEKMKISLDMTSRFSKECRKTSVDLVKDKPKKLGDLMRSIRPPFQRSLEEFTTNYEPAIQILSMPKRINWRALKEAYEFQPKNYEELISIKGIGPSTIRALALISELIYGDAPSWKDPVKYSFAVGGKDGVPYPVDRRAMDRSIEILKDGISQANLGNKERLKAVKRLRDFVPEDVEF